MKNNLPWLLGVTTLSSFMAIAQPSSPKLATPKLQSISIEGFELIRLTDNEAYSQNIFLQSGQRAAISLKIETHPARKNWWKALIPFVSTTATGLISRHNIYSSHEGTRSSSTIPYLSVGTALSTTTLIASRNVNRAYLTLTYHSSDGKITTKGQWIKNKTFTSIVLNDGSKQGWVNVNITAAAKQTLSVEKANYSVQTSAIETNTANLAITDSTDNVPEVLPDSPDEPQTNLTQPCDYCPPSDPLNGGSIPEVVVTGRYNNDQGGELALRWDSFLSQFSGSPNVNTYYTSAQPKSSGNTLVSTMQPPTKNLIKYAGMRRVSLCNARDDMWNWSYGNNDPSSTVEISGYQLADGTFLMLPTSSNGSENCAYWITQPFKDYTGSFEYNIQPRRDKQPGLEVWRYDYLRQVYTYYPITAYVHTHPYTYGYNSNVYNPTPSTPTQQYGDWQVSYEYGIPGIIITQDRVVTYHYDSVRGRVVDNTFTNRNYCSPTPMP